MDSTDFIAAALAKNAPIVSASMSPQVETIPSPSISPVVATLTTPALSTDFDIDTAALDAGELQYWIENREFIRDTWNSTDASYQFYAIDYKVKAALVKCAAHVARTRTLAEMPAISSRDNRELFVAMILTDAEAKHSAAKTAQDMAFKIAKAALEVDNKAAALEAAGFKVAKTTVTTHADDSVSTSITMSDWTVIGNTDTSDAACKIIDPEFYKTTSGSYPAANYPEGVAPAGIVPAGMAPRFSAEPLGNTSGVTLVPIGIFQTPN